jgi:Family of unknown function (DUF6084)
VAELSFAVLDVRPDRYAVAPTLVVRLRVEDPAADPVHALALRAQVTLEPQRRPYGAAEAARLLDLFGERDRWVSTLRPMTWTTCSAVVPGFTGAADVDLPLPCTYDLDVAAARYLQALDGGDVPLRLLFSGTVFRRGTTGLRIEPVPWSAEAAYRMPVAVWCELVDLHWPDSGWLRLRRDTLRALQQERAATGATSWEETIEGLLERARGPGVRP